ncbi:MAG: protease pro-enzyme activation domain-containing protein [Fimbriimonadaceae bacterium]
MQFRAFAIAMFALGALGSATSTLAQAPSSILNVEAPSAIYRSLELGPTNPSRLLHIAVSLPLGDPIGLEAYVDSVSDPASPEYRHFLTPEQIGSRFGMPSSQVQQVADYLKGEGFNISLIAKNHMSILADATVAQAETAFGTHISNFATLNPSEPGNAQFFSFKESLKTPPGIAPLILDVTGLESFTRPHFQTLTPTQTRTLYGLAPLWSNGYHGEGRNIAISNWDGYRLSNVPLYYAQYGLPTPSGGVGSNITVVPISGGAGGGTPGAEGDLDIQMVLGMAPLCNLTIYDGGNSDLIGVLTQEANDNKADVITESYGWNLNASTATAAHNLHLSMSAEGITYMAASGDSGTSLEPYSYPDYDPEVLMVGGSIATTNSGGTRTSEVGWSGSGGGWSTNTATFNVLPAWQKGTGVPTTISHRLVPDVALHASGGSSGAYYFYLNGSLSSAYIGTSFASPVFAGSLGVTEQQVIANGGLPPDSHGKQRFGRIQDLFYSQNGRSDVWHDITSGSNGTLPNGSKSNAGPGWDFVTGWGAINFSGFAASQGPATPNFSISAAPASQTVNPGNGTSYTVSVGALAGFTGSVGLTVSGLPSGAGAGFSPTSISTSGTSTLSVTTSSATPTGTYTLTVTGTSGSLVHLTTVTLVVQGADFTITASPASQTVKHNSSTTFTVTVTGNGGFGGVVGLTVTGLPGSTTSAFTPTSVTGSGTSTLRITTTSASPRGTYTLTIHGTSGTLAHTTTVKLTISRH